MKKLLKTFSSFRPVLLSLLLIGVTHGLFAQNEFDEKSAGFLILIETIDSEIRLTCKEGCAWGTLSYSTVFYLPQAIDQYGMRSLKENKPDKEGDRTDFLFTIQRDKEGLALEGLKGTHWETLSFSCPQGKCKQAIDQSGMTTIK
jgi:hypothetical protein